MAKECCPTCGRTFATRKPAVSVSVDLSTLSTAELFAHYKRTAPIEDVRFPLRVGIDLGPFRDDWQALLNIAPTLTRAETYRRLEQLRGEWRRARNTGRPQIGSPAWAARRNRADAYQVAQQAQSLYLAPVAMNGGRTYRKRLDPKRLVA